MKMSNRGRILTSVLTFGLVLVILILGILSGDPNSERCPKMPLVSTEGQNQKIDFGSIPSIDSLTQMTLAAWAKPESGGEGPAGRIADKLKGTTINDTTGWSLFVSDSAAVEEIAFQIIWDDAGNIDIAVWGARGDFTFGEWTHFAVTYDAGAYSNDPIIYVNGVSATLDVDDNPLSTSTFRNHTGNLLLLNRDAPPGSLDRDFDGEIGEFRVYDRILSAAEIKALADMRGAAVNDAGLKFHCPIEGASGLQTFDGTTLAAANKLVDRIAGVKGTPSGTTLPAARGKIYTALGG